MSTAPEVTLFGRSSSHFTRVTRIFAATLEVPHRYEVVRDLMSANPDEYGGNPALRLPVLQSPAGPWFGSLGICRELARRSPRNALVVWPEDLVGPLANNAQELVLQAMATEVTLIMEGLVGSAVDTTHRAKLRASLAGMVESLDRDATAVVENLPSKRTLSFLEVTLFCFATHLEFREVLSLRPYQALGAFCTAFGTRPAAIATPFMFDST